MWLRITPKPATVLAYDVKNPHIENILRVI